MTTTGQVPALTSALVTTMLASMEHASVMVIPPAKPSTPTTVISGADTSPAEQPSSVVVVIVPTITGAWVSSTFII